MSQETSPANPKLETASFAGGCFWCTEAFFETLKGVEAVVSGYQGGTVKNPTYEEVTSGRTGHAEATQIRFDPAVITYQQLLDVFFKIHDPTTLNRQGADVGTQYRSAIFAYGPEQLQAAKDTIQSLTEAKAFAKPIVTEVVEAPSFYPAENYHQDYFERNPHAPYCRLVIVPKMKKIDLGPLKK